ncbi:PhoU domain-containing protein [Sulfurospirillum sp. 1307]|jgi:phosphate transport system protein
MIKNYDIELKNVKKDILNIFEGLKKANDLILEGMKECNKDTFEGAKSNIKNTTNKLNNIDNSIIKLLALYAPEAKDLREVVAYLKITTELSRASTNTRSFIRGFIDTCEDIDKNMINEYAMPLQRSTIKALDITIGMFHVDCPDEIRDCFNEVLIEENKTDDLYEILEKNILKDSKKVDDFEKIHKILRAFRKSAKIADRTISIANLLVYIKVGGTLQKV